MKWLLGFDGSNHAEKAVEHAKLLCSPDDTLILLNACKEKHKTKVNETLLAKIQELKATGISAEHFIDADEDARQALVKYAKEEDCDFIIVGRRGYGPLLRAFVGSVSSYVVRYAECPVLLVRTSGDISAVIEKKKPLVWLVPLDGSTRSDKALSYLLKLIDVQSEVNVSLVTVVENTQTEKRGKSHWRAMNYLVAAEKKVKKHAPEASTFTHVIQNQDPRTAICHLAKQVNANYIIMGSKGQSNLEKMIMGSVSSYVLRNAPCPVMICKD